MMVDASTQVVRFDFEHPSCDSPMFSSDLPLGLNNNIRFPSSSPSSSPISMVSKHEQTPRQTDTSLLLSSPVQTSVEVLLSSPRQVATSIPQISTPQTATMFQGESISSNFQAIMLSQLTRLRNLK